MRRLMRQNDFKLMKTRIIQRWTAGITLAALPFFGGCMQSADSAPLTMVAESNAAPIIAEDVVSNAPNPETAVESLETAPAKVVSQPAPATQTANLNSTAAEVAKLAQAGVDDNVMMAYVTNSPHTFNLTADQIVYLNDIGVPGDVVTAMIQHDQLAGLNSSQPAPAPAYSNAQPSQDNQTTAAEAPLTPPAYET